MHLQSLELFGFKSFADKTVFSFHQGVTAIVGPNGCGKSNLLDAVRWVLGEQSAKSLRGGEMADVIFNGTDTRKPLGFAEVSVTFGNCEAELGVEWNEVRVTRRVYRDGNSEYLLNKTACRLRDIQNLFADTGVARAAYSMMEQGRIDMILSSHPEDRRAVFEEAAGITKYKAQKREALRKLEATEANLLRIGDVIKEVKRQIGSLQRQAGKARRYQALHADLRVLDLHYSRKQLAALEAGLAQCRAEIDRIVESEQQTRAKIDAGETGQAEERHALDKIDIEIADARAEAQRVQSDITARHSRIEFNRLRAAELAELIERARNDIAAAEAKQRELASQAEQLDGAVANTRGILQAKETELSAATEFLASIRAQREARQSQRTDVRESVAKLEQRIASLQDDLSSLNARREVTSQQLAHLAEEISRTIALRERLGAEITAARSQTDQEQQTLARRSAETRAAEKSLQRERELLSRAESDWASIDRALAEKRSALEVLRQLNQQGEGLEQGSQAVLRGMDDPERFRDTVVGPLVAQLHVERSFVPAIEGALGRNLHAVVLKDGGSVAEIVARLTKKKFGQAALCVPRLGGSAPESVRKTLPPGAIGWAVDKVTAPRAFEPLIRRLLSEVVIFADLERALACKKQEPALAMATLDGEFISAEGVIFGGSNVARRDSWLDRKARVTALADEENALAGQRELLLERCEELRTELDKASHELERTRAAEQAAHVVNSTAAGRISLLETEQETVTGKIDNLQSDTRTLEEQIKSADERVAQIETDLSELRRELDRRQNDRASVEQDENEARLQEERAREQITELKLALATEQQRYENLRAQCEAIRARDLELTDLIAARRADIVGYENKMAAQADESHQAERLIAEQTTRAMELETYGAALGQRRATRTAEVERRETELRELRHSLSNLQNDRAQQQVRESQLRMEIQHLGDRVGRQYHFDLRAAAPDEAVFEKTLRAQFKRWIDRSAGDANTGGEAASDLASRSESAIHLASDLSDEDLQKLIVDLTQQLDNMGPVNLEAVQEYDELEERYKFLEAQNTDLTNSRRELLEVIARINATTKQMFAETFTQIRGNFREMFAEMFGGGRADLSLLDESDPLNCGIEITAKPPGKQLQSISLLSGGERSMVAIALLFAIYMVRPSPFCVLDEIDAPLDETNINRFLAILERFVSQSQFIIITHNKRTIAKADVLYGVTMEERGVSKLVTMKLIDAPADKSQPETGETVSSQRQFALAENGRSETESSFAAR
ncbi:MAG TPA: chromosome segregation protein SMC [Chthoniobacterales bacterium]|nr:chromosome segregation protein SMC [Chthoniobacterales bacterium]